MFFYFVKKHKINRDFYVKKQLLKKAVNFLTFLQKNLGKFIEISNNFNNGDCNTSLDIIQNKGGIRE